MTSWTISKSYSVYAPSMVYLIEVSILGSSLWQENMALLGCSLWWHRSVDCLYLRSREPLLFLVHRSCVRTVRLPSSCNTMADPHRTSNTLNKRQRAEAGVGGMASQTQVNVQQRWWTTPSRATKNFGYITTGRLWKSSEGWFLLLLFETGGTC